jgi:hypothetical protein
MGRRWLSPTNDNYSCWWTTTSIVGRQPAAPSRHPNHSASHPQRCQSRIARLSSCSKTPHPFLLWQSRKGANTKSVSASLDALKELKHPVRIEGGGRRRRGDLFQLLLGPSDVDRSDVVLELLELFGADDQRADALSLQ